MWGTERVSVVPDPRIPRTQYTASCPTGPKEKINFDNQITNNLKMIRSGVSSVCVCRGIHCQIAFPQSGGLPRMQVRILSAEMK